MAWWLPQVAVHSVVIWQAPPEHVLPFDAQSGYTMSLYCKESRGTARGRIPWVPI
jgi:hypothetical protein